MPDFAAAFRDFFTATTLGATLAAIGILTAGVGWVLARNRGARKAAALHGAENAYENWDDEGGLIFPSGGGGDDFHRQPVDNRFTGGIEAVRERPLEFLAGALAAGFAAGLLLPIFSNRKPQPRLLERLVEGNEESRTLAQREAERFRQARPK